MFAKRFLLIVMMLIGVLSLAAVLFFVPVRSAIGISQGIVVPLVLIPS